MVALEQNCDVFLEPFDTQVNKKTTRFCQKREMKQKIERNGSELCHTIKVGLHRIFSISRIFLMKKKTSFRLHRRPSI